MSRPMSGDFNVILFSRSIAIIWLPAPQPDQSTFKRTARVLKVRRSTANEAQIDRSILSVTAYLMGEVAPQYVRPTCSGQ